MFLVWPRELLIIHINVNLHNLCMHCLDELRESRHDPRSDMNLILLSLSLWIHENDEKEEYMSLKSHNFCVKTLIIFTSSAFLCFSVTNGLPKMQKAIAFPRLQCINECYCLQLRPHEENLNFLHFSWQPGSQKTKTDRKILAFKTYLELIKSQLYVSQSQWLQQT